MVISVTGTHGTGKTTLAYNICTFLKKKGVNTVVLDELARECRFPINEEAIDETHAWLIASQIKKELDLMLGYEVIIADRSVLDPYVYGLSKVFKGSANFKLLKPYCVAHIKKYYGRIYMLNPTAFNYCEVDGVRSTDLKWRSEVHKLFVKTFNEEEIEYDLITNVEDVFKDLSFIVGG